MRVVRCVCDVLLVGTADRHQHSEAAFFANVDLDMLVPVGPIEEDMSFGCG